MNEWMKEDDGKETEEKEKEEKWNHNNKIMHFHYPVLSNCECVCLCSLLITSFAFTRFCQLINAIISFAST